MVRRPNGPTAETTTIRRRCGERLTEAATGRELTTQSRSNNDPAVPAEPLGAVDPAPGDPRDDAALAAGTAAGMVVALVAVQLARAPAWPAGAPPDRRHRVERPTRPLS
jgi:hypothetical protein